MDWLPFFAGAVFGVAVTLTALGTICAAAASWLGAIWLRAYIGRM